MNPSPELLLTLILAVLGATLWLGRLEYRSLVTERNQAQIVKLCADRRDALKADMEKDLNGLISRMEREFGQLSTLMCSQHNEVKADIKTLSRRIDTVINGRLVAQRLDETPE